jgi:hypothetical protein
MIQARWIALCLGAALAGCAGISLGVPRQAFTASSLDANRGERHRIALEGSELASVADRAIELGRVRELTLVKQSECGAAAKRCELAFRGKPVDRRIFRNAQTAVLSYFSRYFLRLERSGARIVVSAVGVPVLGGEMACPPAAATELACKPPLLNRQPDQDLPTSVKREWGYDISGAGEAEILQGLLDELRRSPRSGGAASISKRAIVAVFDVEDQARALAPAALAGLTEYLATKVTQAGYQVVPRDQLRSRLASEKRESYKHCFEQRCQIELGRALAAQKSLATKLLRVGGQCVLTAQLYDLRSETAERAGSAKSACGEAALLTAIDELARQLAGP